GQTVVGQTVVGQTAALSDITSLDDLRATLAGLDGCALKHTASNMIFADGNPGAKVMVIGDVPGRDEDRVGLPLVGSDGQLLDRMLASIGLSRAEIYIVPLIPWRPPGNRTPTAEEMALLVPFLYRHVQLAAPEMVLLLGGVTAKTILPSGGGILKLRGRWHDIDYGGTTCPTMATLHPAYLSRSPAQKRLAFADLVALAGKLG
ncbi:MAG: uracil-DNA glycosylase, partial [Candidatus Puniceispirillaceae bacterium]